MNNNTDMISFAFSNKAIRMVSIDGNPWFVAADVAEVLGFTTTAGAGWYIRHLDSSETNTITLTTGRRGNPTRKLISESGLYKLIMRSDKPEAKPFQDWVTKVVLPAIRKDGMYVMGEEKLVSGEMSAAESLADLPPRASVVLAVVTNRDAEGRYCLNDFQKAAGGEEQHRPSLFFRNASTEALVNELLQAPDLVSEPVKHIRSGRPETQSLVSEIENTGNSRIKACETKRGRNGDTWVVKEVVYAYVMWISPTLHLNDQAFVVEMREAA